ncbi:unnamed protein product, partial [Mesorhabditis belari]|uniref:PDZ domain-containing protein n=1 Tax=Mesorhabditis belari TaxID=2138241 RepID=A0AAF3ELX8_9BILA
MVMELELSNMDEVIIPPIDSKSDLQQEEKEPWPVQVDPEEVEASPSSTDSIHIEMPDITPGTMFTTTLVKTEHGLGFNIIGGTDSQHLPGNNCIFISMIKPDGAAAKDLRIREGDRIVSMNGIELDELRHDEVVTEFQKISVGGEARLLIEAQADLKLVSEAHLRPQTLSDETPGGDSQPSTSQQGLLANIDEKRRKIDVISILSRNQNNLSPDDVPKTPRKPFSVIDPRNNSLFTELLYVSIGLGVIAVGSFAFYRWWNRGK